MPEFSETSQLRLKTCHPDLQDLFNEVIKYRDCTILCGQRGRHDQNRLFQEGKSKAPFPQSKHNYEPSYAVDVMPYPIDWENIDGVIEFAGFVMGMSAHMGINIKWGGHFKGFFDGPHYELKM